MTWKYFVVMMQVFCILCKFLCCVFLLFSVFCFCFCRLPMEGFQFLYRDQMEQYLLLHQYAFLFFFLRFGYSYWCVLIMISNIWFYYLQSMPHSRSQTVVVENPMSIDSSGKLVSTIAFLFCLVLDTYLTKVCF